MLDAGEPLGAHRAFGRCLGVALDVDDLAVADGYQRAAAAVTTFTGCLDDLFFTHVSILFVVLGIMPVR